MGDLVGDTIEITDVSLEDIANIITSEEIKERLDTLFNGNINIEAHGNGYYYINNHLLFPYFQKMDFPDTFAFEVNLDIDLQTVNTMEDIKVKKLMWLKLLNDSFYLLHKVRVSDISEIGFLYIHSDNTELNNEIVNNMDLINLGCVKNLNIDPKVVYLLPKLRFAENNVMDSLIIYGVYSGINNTMINGMGCINVGYVKTMELYNDASYFLSKRFFADGNLMEPLHIDPENSYIDNEIINYISHINNIPTKKLVLKGDAIQLLLKMNSENSKMIQELRFQSNLYSCLSKEAMSIAVSPLRSIKNVIISRKLIDLIKCFPTAMSVEIEQIQYVKCTYYLAL
eukprot:GHVP01062535.1.p1 GENE.GHVP01062535.1~~GHVP01062535.1.p1  ORF type:complete len:341 (-),score=37.81 GHVP01062535.1:1432-2454(-)